MARFLIAATAVPGHVLPLLAVAQHLVSHGHEVVVHTGSVFRERAEATGARFVAFRPEIDIDYRQLDERFPERRNIPPGPAQFCFGLQHLFADAIPHQSAGIADIHRDSPLDAIIVDTMFCGTFPLLLGPRETRVPIVAPRQGSRPLPSFLFDAMITLPDLYLQLTAKAFEYPRGEMPDSIRFVGPLLPPPSTDFRPPPWWDDVGTAGSIVLVTQGTVANQDLGQLVGPTLTALANEDLMVIASTGGPPVEAIPVPLPRNARAASFLPFDRLLPKVSVMVTNGGYGAVNHALSLGVPLVVAGNSEEKPEIAARVAWAGAGINLGTGRPSASQISQAVRTVLTQPHYRQRAQELRTAFARHNARDEIAELVEGLAANGSAAGGHANARRGIGSAGAPAEAASPRAVDVDTASIPVMSRTI